MRRPGFAMLALAAASPCVAAPILGPAFSDSMVIQRGQDIVLEGKATPNSKVEARLGGHRGSARAGDDGSFRITLPALPASRSGMDLLVEDSSGQTRYRDIAVGDVILCAGQSNMELPVTRALDTSNQLRRAADESIRLFTVPKATAPVPQDRFAQPISWKKADSDSVADFSAACFFMAKRLRTLDPEVPVGLIHSNWGGSAARAWLTQDGVARLYGQPTLDLLRVYAENPLAATKQFVPQWMDWWRARDSGREPWVDSSLLDLAPIPQFSFWNDWKGTGLDTDPTANVWLHNSFNLSAEQAERSGQLSIGAIDDLDLTFVNGEPVGYTFGWGVERTYTVPQNLLREGKNEVLIAANNMWDQGGFFAGPDRLFFTPGDGSPAVALGEGWKYARSQVDGTPPRAPWDANAGTGVMHNAMIAPLGPIRLAAVAWYQGESDVGQADYDTKLAALFAGWRAQFGPAAKMLVVQLADFGQRTSEPGESGWAQLRQDQLDGVSADANATLVTAIDIGEASDIHPANKNVLGERLADAFRGDAMPMPRRAVREGSRIRVSFDGLSGDLVAQGGPVALGVEVCGEAAGSCRYVLPRLEGPDLLIEAGEAASPARVRHAWSDAPIVNLYDESGRPVPGFELTVE